MFRVQNLGQIHLSSPMVLLCLNFSLTHGFIRHSWSPFLHVMTQHKGNCPRMVSFSLDYYPQIFSIELGTPIVRYLEHNCLSLLLYLFFPHFLSSYLDRTRLSRYCERNKNTTYVCMRKNIQLRCYSNTSWKQHTKQPLQAVQATPNVRKYQMPGKRQLFLQHQPSLQLMNETRCVRLKSNFIEYASKFKAKGNF